MRIFRSRLALPGTTICTGRFIIAPSMAYAIPALPELESRTIRPFPIWPEMRASSSIRRTGRSFKLPPGFVYSAFAKTRTSGNSFLKQRISTIRVLPIKLSAGYRSWNSAYRVSTGIVANEFIRSIHKTKAAPESEPHPAPIGDDCGLYSYRFLVVRLVGSVSGELFDGIVVGVNVTANTTEQRD